MWRYLFGLFIVSSFLLVVASMVYVTYDHIPQHKSKDWAKCKWTQLDSTSEWKTKVERNSPFWTESAWPTEITTVGLLASSTASPSVIAVPFTA